MLFAGTLGISKRDFYAKIGVSRGTLESKTGITEEVITKFFATYPEVNIEWLMLGIGEMLKTKRTPQKIYQSKTDLVEDKGNDFNQKKQADEPFVDKLLTIISTKNLEIGDLREEIGQLKERIAQLEREKNAGEESFQAAPMELSKSTVDL